MLQPLSEMHRIRLENLPRSNETPKRFVYDKLCPPEERRLKKPGVDIVIQNGTRFQHGSGTAGG
jgi:hypothetical protein